jgi:predicted PurR-regulated permease PerM
LDLPNAYPTWPGGTPGGLLVIQTLYLNPALRWGLTMLILLGGVIALSLGQSIFIPTVIALLLAAMLWPAVHGLHRGMRFSWPFASLVVVLGLVVLNLLVTTGLFLSVPKFLQDLPGPHDDEGLKEVYKKFRDQVSKIAPLDEEYLPADADKSRVFQYVRGILREPYVTPALLKVAYYANMWLWQWVLILFILLFLLAEGPMLTRRFVDIFGPSESAKHKAVLALSDMAHHVRTYLVWRTIINFGMALVAGFVYEKFGLKQPWTWSVLTAILLYIPYLGPLAAGIFPLIDAFIVVSPWVALEVLLFYVVMITFEGYVIVPVVMGRSMELNATTVLLACLFWELVWGLPGLFLAMPLMAAIKAICTNVPDWRPWANLMSTAKGEIRLAREEDGANETTASPEKTQLLSKEEMKALGAAARLAAEPKPARSDGAD